MQKIQKNIFQYEVEKTKKPPKFRRFFVPGAGLEPILSHLTSLY